MAYTVKWFSEFSDESGDNIYAVEILDRNFSGEAIEVLSAESPVRIQMMDVDSPFQVMRSLKFTFEWISDEVSGFDISDLFITDDRKYKFQLSLYQGEIKKLLYVGYLVFVDCQEPFSSKPYPVTLTGTCSLPFVRDDYFLTEFGQFVEGKVSLIKLIANCLSSTGLGLPIHTRINLFEQGMPNGLESSLALAEIDADGLRGKKGSEVLEGILGALNAFIIQSEGAWLIQGVREQESFLGQERRFDSAGNSTGYALVGQAASFGRTPYNSVTPNVRPIDGVRESFAEPNSIASVQVNPGIPVNRLANGAFSGPIFGGNLSNWNINLSPLAPGREGSGWTRSGTGKPDDPYKMDMTGAIVTPNTTVFPRLGMSSIGYIEFNTGSFLTGKNIEYPKYKVIISGAYRAADISFFQLYVRLNDGDRQEVSYLTDGGEWYKTKRVRDAKYIKITPSQPVTIPFSEKLEDAALQTFEIEADIITNYLNRSGQNIARLYFDVRAAQIFANSANDFREINPRLTWEDFSVIVTTETAFEGNHTYRVDAKFPIRNPNEADHTVIIADKAGIETPEQKRPENRVMTGYMTLLGGNTLTQGWKRFPGGNEDSRDSIYEPIQKKCLRERVRLYCGKRTIIEGSFKGVGLLPHHTIFSRYDTLGFPTKFSTITAWEWRIKEMEYNTSFFELNFDPLDDEVIELVSEGEGRRGNRMYSGGGGSSQSGSPGTSKPAEEIVVDDIEPYEYEILVEDEEERICDIAELLISNHTAEQLKAQILSWPPWISEISLYTGADLDEEELPEGGILQVEWLGKPDKSGSYQILVELIADDGADCIVSIPITVEGSEDFIESWPPKFVDLPPLYFIADKAATRELDLKQYLDPEGEHDGTGLSPRLLSTPYWVSDSRIVFMNLSVIGNPDRAGESYFVTYEISDAIGRTTTIAFRAIVLDPSFMSYELLDTSDLTPVLIGNLPGVYTLPSGKIDVAIRVKGDHDFYRIFLTGGGANGNTFNRSLEQNVKLNADGNYRFFKEDNGIVATAGQYSVSADTYLAKNFIFGETIDFVLYDEEFLEAIKFFLTKGSTVLGEVVQDGTSSFIDPVTANFGIEVLGEHDKVILRFDSVDPVIVEHEAPEVDYTYVFSDEDFALNLGQHTVSIEVYLNDEKTATRYAKFETVADKPKPVAGLKLITMIPNTTDYTVIGEIPLTGGSFELPANWSIISDGESDPYDSEKGEIWQLKGDGLVEINTQIYTRQPNYNIFGAAVTKSNFQLFRGMNSTQIGGIHEEGTTFRVRFTRSIDGLSGTQVKVFQGDFTFGPPVDIEDTPIKQPGDNIVDYFAGDALNEEVEGFIKTFNVKVDGETIIINEDNQLELNADFFGGITGTAGTISKFGLDNTLIDSILSETGDLLTAKGSLYLNSPGENRILLYTENGMSATIYRDQTGNDLYWFQSEASAMRINLPGVINDAIRIARATGDVSFARAITLNTGAAAPIITNSTALNTNFNADLFEGYHGPYYLNRANHTGTQLAATISDFVASARLSISEGIGIDYDTATGIIRLDTVFADNRYAAKEHTHLLADISDYDGINGTGNVNFVPLFTAAKTLASSVISQTEGNLKVEAGSTVFGVSSAQKVAMFAEAGYAALAFQNVAANVNHFVLAGKADKLTVDIPSVINDAFYINRSDGSAAFARQVFGQYPEHDSSFATREYVDDKIADVVITGPANKVTRFLSGGGIGETVITQIDNGISAGKDSVVFGSTGREAFVVIQGTVRTRGYTAAQLAAMGGQIGETTWQNDGVIGPVWFNGSSWEKIGGTPGISDTLLIGSSGTINASAALEVRSTTKAFIPPRMTLAQMSAIPNPVEGMMVYAAVTLGSTTGHVWQYRRTESGALIWDICQGSQP